ncbi:MAG: transcriptional regulator [Candidatus Muproteobacteria bacterium RIFCSPHIGHO2_01_FULL_65_16]|uniref:Transcriptional regulator n=2 Tax=Candidatus Muproteobacteria TaxID=1817795 RepID=A0A1F6TP12_9PROT|nr:MAG: transcriptional regulator [Candidatus Muproteobacteria bacterium RIFCSPHIGHO2_01_FULL_65_16]OGI52057.1 MAG: transcriptional regulator [Candidatus Muproteobacteria bacterium RIFCSPHIGHO2_02_FULL_65_16]
MYLTLRQLKVFEAVARHLNYTRAAEELHLTQPAVSMQVTQLEKSLGIALFEQLGKRIHLTEAGREVHAYTRAIAQQLDELEAVLNRIKGLSGGRLRISVATTANYFIPTLLGTFSRRYPDVTVSLDVTNRETLLRQLSENTVDLVIMGQPPAEADVEAEAFMDNPLVVVAPPDHPLARQKKISLARLQDETFLVRESGSGTRIAMERFFAERGMRLKTGMEVGSNEAIKQSVQAGLGLGLLSRATIEQELALKRLVVLDVEDFPIMRHWYVVHRKGKRLSAAAEAYKQFMLAEAATLPTAGGNNKSSRKIKRGRR